MPLSQSGPKHAWNTMLDGKYQTCLGMTQEAKHLLRCGASVYRFSCSNKSARGAEAQSSSRYQAMAQHLSSEVSSVFMVKIWK